MSAYHENLIFDDKLPVKVILHTDRTWRKRLVLSHWHNSIEVCYVVGGHPGSTIINGRTYTLKPHQMFVVGPNVIHSFDAVVTSKDEILTVLIPLNWLSDEIDYFNDVLFNVGPLQLDAPEYQKLENMLRKIVVYKRESQLTLSEELSTVAAIHYLAAFVMEDMSVEKTSKADSIELGSPLVVQQILTRIKQDYGENLTIAQLSEENHVSQAHLIRSFKKYVGQSPKNFLVQTRLDAASKLLRQTTQSINEIAEATGFGSTKNFFVLFHKKYEMTPNDYRQKILN